MFWHNIQMDIIPIVTLYEMYYVYNYFHIQDDKHSFLDLFTISDRDNLTS